MKINRTKPFDLEHLKKFRGGREYSACYHHPSSMSLTKFSLDDVVILQGDVPGEEDQDPWKIPVEERLARLDDLGLIAPDAQIFQTIWNQRRRLPDKFRSPDPEKVFELRFLGTLFSAPGNPVRCILSMNYDCDRKRWYRHLTASVFPDEYRPLLLIKKDPNVQVPISSPRSDRPRPACLA